jgi:DNA (cytosine-5)-methyltransferase 1
MKKTLAVADIFCGAGGLSAGFANAQAWWNGAQGEHFEIVFATDRDKQAMRTFRASHFPEVTLEREDPRAFCGDVSLVNARQVLAATKPVGQVDVLIGGPSCQGLSAAGLRNPRDRRNQMLLAFARLVQELQPLWFVMENVPGLTHYHNRPILAEILGLFEEMGGYRVACDVLLAADYNVPQFRYRLFIIGTRTEAPIRFPSPFYTSANGHSAYPVVYDAIHDLSSVEPTEYDKEESPEPRANAFKNHWCRKIGELDRRRLGAVRAGRDWRDIPIGLLPERLFMSRASDQKGSYGRLSWDWPAYTVTNASLNVSAGAFTHPDHNRCLSVREVARLQSFEDNYEFFGSIESQYRQVGNAVPPKMAQAVAEGILYTHFNPKEAATWGREGRLTHEIVKKFLNGEAGFPILTPRRVHPKTARSPRTKTPRRGATDKAQVQVQAPSAWFLEPRPLDTRPEETRRLRKLAEQPKYVRAAKRAKAIAQFIDGVPREEIVATANVSEASVKKWIDGYFEGGLDGWRAFHSTIEHLGGNDQKLRDKIARKITRVRKVLLSPRREDDSNGAVRRLHMNAYLQELVRAFGTQTVDELIAEVERVLNVSLGTIYVGDLLAIADAVLVRLEQLDTSQALVKLSSKDATETARPNDQLGAGPRDQAIDELWQVSIPRQSRRF